MTKIPIYVTRKTADGKTGSMSLSPGLFGFLLYLVFLNFTMWGLLGIYFAILTAINQF